ncbi:universal stress protein [Immundisolibacter sp.]|uniref:universal stress protein n=1 Tax=Immundisolibacter sp. TaxID=1934948 RepID=UPI0035664DFD
MNNASLAIRKVLVPLDFSDPSLQAVQYARRFADPSGAELVLLYVIEPVAYPAELGVVINLDADLAERAMSELEKLRVQHLSDLSARCLVRNGVADAEIVATAKSESADLIVIGTHGFSGLKHFLLGSTAERVVRDAPCPVLTVRHHVTADKG